MDTDKCSETATNIFLYKLNADMLPLSLILSSNNREIGVAVLVCMLWQHSWSEMSFLRDISATV